MGYKMKRGGAPKYKELGSSPAKQKVQLGKVPYMSVDVSTKEGKDILKRHKNIPTVRSSDPGRVTKKGIKKGIKKGLGKTILKGAGKVAKFAAKRLGPIGAAITAAEAARHMQKIHPIKNFGKDVKKSLKKEAKTGSTIGKPKY